MIDLTKMIDSFTHRHVFIQTHNFPDPDAIASAYGLQYLLHSRGLESTIIYKGKVEHGSSNAMVKKLGIKIIEYSDMTEMSQDAEIILVDSAERQCQYNLTCPEMRWSALTIILYLVNHNILFLI